VFSAPGPNRYDGTAAGISALVLICLLACPSPDVLAGDEQWSSAFAHSADLDGPILSMVMYGEDLIVGGSFSAAGNTTLNGVARWDGVGWRPLGNGIPGAGSCSNYVESLVVFRGQLYAEGWCWDGETWTEVFAVDGAICCQVVHDDIMVVGGCFTTAQGIPSNDLFLWDGESVNDLGGACNGSVYALLSHGGELYAGGNFTVIGGVPAERIACWDGDAWSGLAGGIHGDQVRYDTVYGMPYNFPARVSAICAHDGDIYVGGQFTMAGEDSIMALASWDGADWHAQDGLVLADMTEFYSMDSWQDFPPCVYALVVDAAGGLVAGGRFSVSGDPIRYGLVRRGEGGWDVPGGGFDYDGSFYMYIAYALVSTPGRLVVGGRFFDIGGIEAVSVASWNGSEWSSLVIESGLGTNGRVFSSLVYQDGLICAGNFSRAGNLPAGCIANFKGDRWAAVGEYGIGGSLPTIRDMIEFEGELVVTGRFVTVDGLPARNVARWDGESWQAMGEGLNCHEGAALCEHDGDLYAAGGDWLYPHPIINPQAKQSSDPGCVYRWNGSMWDLIMTTNSYVGGSIWDLASYDGDLLVAGSFTEIDGQPLEGLVRWDGMACSQFGDGLIRRVRCLEVVGDDLYIGGWFTFIEDMSKNYLVRWDGAAWQDVAGGLGGGSSNYGVYDLLHVSGRLYVGGRFDTAGGVPANNVAALADGVWRALGSGADPTVSTLAWYRGDLYVGGDLEMAGGKIVDGLARWEGEPVPVMVSGFEGRRVGLAVELSWQARGGMSGSGFAVWRDDGDGALDRLDVGADHGGPVFSFLDMTAPATQIRYRLQWIGDDGSMAWAAETTVAAADLPRVARFVGVHPNPFNPRISAEFTVGAPQHVRISVHDARGRELVRLADRGYAVGRHGVSWEGLDEAGRTVPAGVYFLRLEADDGSDTVKVSLLR